MLLQTSGPYGRCLPDDIFLLGVGVAILGVGVLGAEDCCVEFRFSVALLVLLLMLSAYWEKEKATRRL